MRHHLVGLLCFALCVVARADDVRSRWERDRAEFKNEQEKICVVIDALLAGTDCVELVAIDPFLPPLKAEESGDRVGRFRVRKRVIIRDAGLINQISAALQKSVTDCVDASFPNSGAQIFPVHCFEPQHALRVLFQGKEVYIVAGNICGNGIITNMGDDGVSFQLTKSWYAPVESIFIKVGLPPSSPVYLSREQAYQRLQSTTPPHAASTTAP